MPDPPPDPMHLEVSAKEELPELSDEATARVGLVRTVLDELGQTFKDLATRRLGWAPSTIERLKSLLGRGPGRPPGSWQVPPERYLEVFQRLQSELGRNPTHEEIGAELSVSARTVRRNLKKLR